MSEKQITARLGMTPVCTGCGKRMTWLENHKETFIRCETVGCSQYFVECEFPTFILKKREKQADTGKNDFFAAIRAVTGDSPKE
jgi:hypothetical protein